MIFGRMKFIYNLGWMDLQFGWMEFHNVGLDGFAFYNFG